MVQTQALTFDNLMPPVDGVRPYMLDAGTARDEVLHSALRALVQRSLDAVPTRGTTVEVPDIGRPTNYLHSFRDENRRPPSPTMKTVDRFRQMATWAENWDGEGAPRPDKAAIDSAILLVGFIAPFEVRTTATLDALGRPMVLLSWDQTEAEIVVTAKDSIEFAVLAPDVADDEGDAAVPFDQATFPTKLKDALVAAGIAKA